MARTLDLKETVNMLIKSAESGDSKNRWDLRVVSWNDGRPKLEKRNYWRKSADEEFKLGKAVGLDINDLEEILARLEEIQKIMKTT